MNDISEDATYKVVQNDEGQYSVWCSDRDLPLGWSITGFTGTKDECLTHISQVWTDMRPRSVRPQMNG
jgi:MbtH protein